MELTSAVSHEAMLNWGAPDEKRGFADWIVERAEALLGEQLDERLARLPVPLNEAGCDSFGFDPSATRQVLAVAAFLHRYYFRTMVHGIENLPKGGALLVANHSGQIPIDGCLMACSLVLDAEPPRVPRNMVEHFVATVPYVSAMFARSGQVIGAPENARRLLQQGDLVIVFPEGVRGISKTFDRRYQLEAFGNGFMRLALETNTPIIPVAVIGGEEQYPSVANLRGVGKALGMPALPVIPQLFFGMALPFPTRYRLWYGKPMHFQGDPDDEDGVVEAKVAEVRRTIQSMVNRGLRERKSVFW